MPDKEDHANKPGMGLVGEMDLGNTEYRILFGMGADMGRLLISFYLLSFQLSLTSLLLELWFGWGGERGLSWCKRAPRGCSPLNCYVAAPR